MNSICPKCNQPVILATVENKRNGKWTILPLERSKDSHIRDWAITDESHEAVDIMGEIVGVFPVAEHVEFGSYRTHSPSHYLGGH